VLDDVVQCDLVAITPELGMVYQADADVHQVDDAISRLHNRVKGIWQGFGGLDSVLVFGSLTVQLTEKFQSVEERHQSLAYVCHLCSSTVGAFFPSGSESNGHPASKVLESRRVISSEALHAHKKNAYKQSGIDGV
jgi:hypothetical protein